MFLLVFGSDVELIRDHIWNHNGQGGNMGYAHGAIICCIGEGKRRHGKIADKVWAPRDPITNNKDDNK